MKCLFTGKHLLQSSFMVFAFPAPPPRSICYYEYRMRGQNSIGVSGRSVRIQRTLTLARLEEPVQGFDLTLASSLKDFSRSRYLVSSQHDVKLPYPRYFFVFLKKSAYFSGIKMLVTAGLKC